MLGCVSYGNLSNSTRLEPAQHSRSCAEIRGLPAAAGARLRVAPSGRGGGRPMTKQSFSQRRVSLSVLRIDRGAHLESAWRRQENAEAARAAAEAAGRGVVELQNLAHLDAISEAAGPDVVAVCFYSRSCGACRKMKQRWAAMCSEAEYQRAGVRFLQHDVRTDYDEPSDVARLYRIRATPSFAFFSDGSKVGEMRMRDIRSMTGSSAAIQSHLAAGEVRLGEALRGVLFRIAPSSRR